MVVDLRGVGGRRRARCLEGRRSCQKAWLPSRGVASRRGLSRRSCARGLAGAPPAYFWSCTHAADSWSSRRRRLRLGSARDGWEREMPAVEPRPLLLVLWERRSHRGRREGRRRETGVGVKGRGEGERDRKVRGRCAARGRCSTPLCCAHSSARPASTSWTVRSAVRSRSAAPRSGIARHVEPLRSPQAPRSGPAGMARPEARPSSYVGGRTGDVDTEAGMLANDLYLSLSTEGRRISLEGSSRRPILYLDT